MTNRFDKFIKVYLTYSEIIGNKLDRNKLETFIESLPLSSILLILCEMSFAGQNNRKIREIFTAYVNTLSRQFGLSYESLLTDRYLYTNQGSLTCWKWLLCYGNHNKLYYPITWDEGINKAILLQIAVADYLYEPAQEEDVIFEIIRNIIFNTRDNLASMIGRTKKIYIDIAKNNKLFNQLEYVDFNSDFIKSYGYSIEEYLTAVFGLLALYVSSDIGSFPLTDLKLAFGNTHYNNIVDTIVNPLCFTFAEGKTWSQQTIESPWNFSLFRQKPILKLDDNRIIPVSYEFLSNQLFSSLYWKIRQCYSSSDDKFQRFFGRPLEIYIQQLLQNAAESSGLDYEFIPEFKYDKNQRSSPDAMLRLGNKLLAVECKAKGVTDLSSIDGKPDSIEYDYNRLINDPYEQLIKRLKELKAGKSTYDFSNVNSYYLLTVNQKDFPHVKPYEDKIINRISNEDQLSIKYFGHCDIEEIELLAYLIGRPGNKPIFNILDNHHKLEPYQSLKNFLFTSSLPMGKPKYVIDATDEFVHSCISTLFPREDHE